MKALELLLALLLAAALCSADNVFGRWADSTETANGLPGFNFELDELTSPFATWPNSESLWSVVARRAAYFGERSDDITTGRSIAYAGTISTCLATGA